LIFLNLLIKKFCFKEMKKNTISTGLKIDKFLRESLYYFIVNKQIDWAIILACIFCVLPYITSNDVFFLLTKLFLFCLIVFISSSYLRTWNQLNNYSKLKLKMKNQFKSYIENKNFGKKQFIKTGDIVKERIKEVYSDYLENSHEYQNFEVYFEKNKSKFNSNRFAIERKDFLSFFVSLSSVLVFFMELIEIPKRKRNNYRKLKLIMLFVFVFFLVYTIENSNIFSLS